MGDSKRRATARRAYLLHAVAGALYGSAGWLQFVFAPASDDPWLVGIGIAGMVAAVLAYTMAVWLLWKSLRPRSQHRPFAAGVANDNDLGWHPPRRTLEAGNWLYRSVVVTAAGMIAVTFAVLGYTLAANLMRP